MNLHPQTKVVLYPLSCGTHTHTTRSPHDRQLRWCCWDPLIVYESIKYRCTYSVVVRPAPPLPASSAGCCPCMLGAWKNIFSSKRERRHVYLRPTALLINSARRMRWLRVGTNYSSTKEVGNASSSLMSGGPPVNPTVGRVLPLFPLYYYYTTASCYCCLHIKNRSDLYPVVPSLSNSSRQRYELSWSPKKLTQNKVQKNKHKIKKTQRKFQHTRYYTAQKRSRCVQIFLQTRPNVITIGEPV